ncbi:Putative ribonuclease H protein At1g65750 [Linum perenne]
MNPVLLSLAHCYWGGMIRDDQGRFVQVFTANIGNWSIARAEMRVVVQGLQISCSIGIRKLIIQTDLMAAISIMQNDDTANQHAGLVAEFCELSSREWFVSIVHVYREANCGADYLANLGHSVSLGLHLFSQPDSIYVGSLASV